MVSATRSALLECPTCLERRTIAEQMENYPTPEVLESPSSALLVKYKTVPFAMILALDTDC